MMCQWLLGRCCSVLCCTWFIIKPVAFTIAYSSFWMRLSLPVSVWQCHCGDSAKFWSEQILHPTFLALYFSWHVVFWCLCFSVQIYRNLQEPSMHVYSEVMCAASQLYGNCFVSSFWVQDSCGLAAFSQAAQDQLIIPNFDLWVLIIAAQMVAGLGRHKLE